ncbi:MAG: hypothetical protein ACKO5Q_16330, partial [Microcystaceae cyanobacterium]
DSKFRGSSFDHPDYQRVCGHFRGATFWGLALLTLGSGNVTGVIPDSFQSCDKFKGILRFFLP